MSKLPTVHASLACWPGMHHAQAAQAAHEGASEGLWGRLSTDHIQLVPQSRGQLTESLAEALKQAYPTTQFRLHANVRVLDDQWVVDLSNLQDHPEWLNRAAAISRRLNAPAYSAHAGRRLNATLQQVFDNAQRAEDAFDVPVAIEGLYPNAKGEFLMSTWAEYETLLKSGRSYAIDLSHLHIVATLSKRLDTDLVTALLSSPQCLEVHVSTNNGMHDRHEPMTDDEGAAPWWWSMMTHAQTNAVWFTEGTQRSRKTQTQNSEH